MATIDDTCLRNALLVLLASALTVFLGTSTLRVVGDSALPDLRHLVFVTEDINMDAKGCDAISVFDLDHVEPVYQGKHFNSPGRLTATSGFTTVLASVSLVMPNPKREEESPFIVWERYESGLNQWQTVGAVRGDAFASVGGLGILNDNDTLLIATVANLPASGDPNQPGPIWPRPYQLRKYRISEFHQNLAGSWQVGPLRGELPLTGIVSEVLPSRFSSVVHLLTDDGWVATIDPADMKELLPRIKLPRIAVQPGKPDRWIGHQHGTLSPDEHYLITNRIQPAELIIVDLLSRKSWTAALPLDVEGVSGVAFNWGWFNHGRLAVHGGDKILIYGMDDLAQLTLVERTPLFGGYPLVPVPLASGPRNSIAWSTDGQYIIAGAIFFQDDDSEFVSLRVSQEGRSITLERRFTACPAPWDSGYDAPNDILTANGLVTPPVRPSVTLTATAPPVVTLTAVATSTSLPSDTASPMPSVTPTSTPKVRPIYLPLVMRASCLGASRSFDVALVLDLSTSMSRQAADGRTKIAGAVDAVTIFIDQLLIDDTSHRIALVGFNNRAWMLHGPSRNVASLKAALRDLPMQLEEGTRLDLALDQGRAALAEGLATEHRTALILLTDGLPNQVPTPANGGTVEESVLVAAARVKSSGTSVYAVGLGRPDAPDILDRINESLLRAIASSPGQYYQTADPSSLAVVYRDLAKYIPCFSTVHSSIP